MVGQVVTSIPTMCNNSEQCDRDNLRFVVIDHYQGNRFLKMYLVSPIHKIVFMIDSSDRDRFDEAKEIFEDLYRNHDQLREIPFVLVANKQDLWRKPTMTPLEIAIRLGLSPQDKPAWKIAPCIASTGDGVCQILHLTT